MTSSESKAPGVDTAYESRDPDPAVDGPMLTLLRISVDLTVPTTWNLRCLSIFLPSWSAFSSTSMLVPMGWLSARAVSMAIWSGLVGMDPSTSS